ncbi:MAG: amidohydrolase [Chitinophagaceae bacterium]|nr:amidohydrolase [Chitinophagaceae bacterium]
MKQFLPLLSFFFLLSCSKKQADMIVHHGVIYTVDSSFTVVEAMAIKDGKIVATGSNDQILSAYTAEQQVDAGGTPIYPGWIDAHAHFVGYGQSLYTVDLFGTSSWEEAVERVKQFAAQHPEMEWIQGRGWDQNKWPGKKFPDNRLLNESFPDRPVVLTRIDGHASIANNEALKRAGIQAGQAIEGGAILANNGVATGVLIDNADNAVYAAMPAPAPADMEKQLLQAQENCFAMGLTSITDCGLSNSMVTFIDSLQQKGKLAMRLNVMLSDEEENFAIWLKKGPYETDRLRVASFKVYGDGALGSRGACLIHDYTDQPGWKGFLLRSIAHYDSIAARLINSPFQMCTHAIGDSANRALLTIYAKYLKGKNDRRWRIEHAQVIHPEDFAYYGNYNIIPSIQPTHATSDMYWAGDRLGTERLKGGYAFRQLLEQNGWIPLGTDFPVEDISPYKTFLASVFRKDSKGFPAGGFQMENALTREQTIRGMTIWAAKAAMQEKQLGSLEAGKKADFILLSQDLMKVTEQQVLATKVVSTYIGGKQVFQQR